MYKYIYGYISILVIIRLTYNRTRIIVDYVSMHQGCTAQDIVDGLEASISRKTIFDILQELTKEGIVKDDRVNRRDHRYFVEAKNPLVSVPIELDGFEKAFVKILAKSAEFIEKKYLPLIFEANKAGRSYEKSLVDVFFLLTEPIDLFFAVADSYLVSCTMQWPTIIKDKETLKKLSALVFTRLADIQLSLSEFLSSVRLGELGGSLSIEFMRRLNGTFRFSASHTRYTSIGMKEEIENTLDTIWKINLGIQELAYPEPSLYKWEDFVYGKDDWRTLLAVQAQHPNETLDEYLEPT
jgi:predicted transcriptional regulator